MALEIQNVCVRLGGKTLLEGIDVAARSGEMTALIGPNGAGKSTLLRVIAAQMAHEGSVRFEGRDVGALEAAERARFMAYVPQFAPESGLGVLEVLELSRRPFGALGANDHALIDEAVAAFALEPLLGRSMRVLSGGERALVGIAAALLQQPRLLLLDEPIAHLDPKNQLDVLQRLSMATKQRGMTTLIVLHDVQHALHFCDALLLMRSGKLQEHLRPDTLQAHHLRRLYDVDARLFWEEGHPFVAFAHHHAQGASHHVHKEQP